MKHTDSTGTNMEKETDDQIIALRQMLDFYLTKDHLSKQELIENHEQVKTIQDELRFLEAGNA